MKALPTIAAALALSLTVPAVAQDAPSAPADSLTYADLVGLAEAAPLVVRAEAASIVPAATVCPVHAVLK